jgi:hypothetical protein
MTRTEAERWITSYNAYAILWNRSGVAFPEMPSLRDHPVWWVDGVDMVSITPKSALYFRPHGDRGRSGVICIRGYERFELEHDFCCLRSARADTIVWAGWLSFTGKSLQTRH